MTMMYRTGRVALALSLAVLAASVPSLRAAVFDWILDAGLAPGMAPNDGAESLAAEIRGFPPAGALSQVQIRH